MKKSLITISLLLVALCAPASRRATLASQEPQKSEAASQPQSAVEHFAKDGLSFDYPAGFKLTDRSNEAAQHLILSRAGSSVLVMVVAYRDAVANGRQAAAARQSITMPYVEDLARRLGVQQLPAWDNNSPCLEVGGRFATGFRLAGKSDGLPSTGEVYALVLGGRFVNLVYVRNDKDDAAGSGAWKSLGDTLKIDAPPGTNEFQMNIVSGGVLNGKAIVKPQPSYPPSAKALYQQGVVTVLIVVGEDGNVISAEAVSGPSALKAEGEKAARRARFEPATVCGRPIKVSGVITYNFVLQ